MDAYLLDWVNLLLRWAHVITAVAWIGASFYFVMLDNSLSKPTSEDLKNKGVDGELWAVHGGGFYHSNKYLLAPRWLPLPENMHWSYWESYSTWLTGFSLFVVLYLFNAGTFLIDKTIYDWSAGAAITTALGFLVAFWLVYDLICRSLGSRKHGDLWVGLLVFLTITVASWAACQLFAGRAAFLLVGAMIATAMSANVLSGSSRDKERSSSSFAPARQSTRSMVSAASSVAFTTPTSPCQFWSRCFPTITAGSIRGGRTGSCWFS